MSELDPHAAFVELEREIGLLLRRARAISSRLAEGGTVEVRVQLSGQPGRDRAGTPQQQADIPLQLDEGGVRVDPAHRPLRGRHTTSALPGRRCGTRSAR